MFYLKKVALSGFVLLSILGCVQPTPSGSKSIGDLPSWYLNPMKSNSQYFYGVGDGSSKEAAKTKALSQIASQISVNVSSSMDISEKTNNGAYTEQTESNIKSSTENIKFTGVTIIENVFANGEFYTNLKVDRSVLFNAEKKVLDIEYDKVLSLWEHMSKTGIFEVLKNSDKLKATIGNIMSTPTLPILKAIYPEFQPELYTQTLQGINNKLRDTKSTAMVFVTAKSNDALAYKKVVQKYISSYGITLVDRPKEASNKNNLLIVEVNIEDKEKNVKTTDPRLKGATFADVSIILTTKDANNKIVAQNRVAVVNISKDGYKSAVIKTAKFEREIENKGIINILLEDTSNL